jgi:hypothetical protein
MLTFARVHGKALFSVVAGVATVVIGARTGDHHIDPSEGAAIVVAAMQLLLVYAVPLNLERKWTKTLIGAVLAAGQVAMTVVLGGIDANDWLLIFTAVAGALGIAVAPAVTITPRATVIAKVGLGD